MAFQATRKARIWGCQGRTAASPGLGASKVLGRREIGFACVPHGWPLGHPVAEGIAAVRERDWRLCRDSALTTAEEHTTSPDDFPHRLERFKEESDLSWAEISRRLGTDPHTVWSWKEGRGRPNAEHMIALLDLADDLGLLHLFTE